MADKAITELTEATQVTDSDSFVLEQSGTAKRLTGHTLVSHLLRMIDGHGGINSIDKKITNGLNDTYTIIFVDGTTFDFVVTNGRSISDVKQTSVSGHTRTYTITFNDGTTENFSITDGTSIKSFDKIKSVGLNDTYSIVLTDGSKFDFTVKNGKEIVRVEKAFTDGLVNTYLITFNDGTTQTFTVNDGKGISSFKKVSSVGLKDEYEIEYTDGTSSRLEVSNGRGIKEIADLGKDGLTNHYEIRFNDDTVSSFSVSDGRGIESFEKIDAIDLTDVYKITYNDGTSMEFRVSNGAKGDPGDNNYVWIKYASQQPTEEFNSIGDLPDNWIGIYIGDLEEAPEDWEMYAWFKIKGETGDPGESATLIGSSVSYQVSSSGTVVPSGSWSSLVPVTPQGKYLWTRTTNTFNTGSPVVSYSVARMGIDGAGSVSSVANISPNSDGNVPLKASDIGAVPSTGGVVIGDIDMSNHTISGLRVPTAPDQAANMGFVEQQVRKAARENLLVNSNFTNPVNQRGQAFYAVTVRSYTIDRWQSPAALTVEVIDSECIRLTCTSQTVANGLAQYLGEPLEVGTTVTYALMEKDGTISAGTTTVPASGSVVAFTTPNGILGRVYTNRVAIMVPVGKSIDVKWVALYKGEYTLDTLPEYRPKGYANELRECMRYYQRFEKMILGLGDLRDNRATISLPMSVQMRDDPTCLISVKVNESRSSSATDLYCRQIGYDIRNICTSASAWKAGNNTMTFEFTFATNFTNDDVNLGQLYISGDTVLELSADLN